MTIHTPPPCINSSMVSYSGKILLLNAGSYPGFTDLANQSWIFNGQNGSNDWTNLFGAGLSNSGSPMPGRSKYALAFDGTNVMLFGGQSSSGSLGILDDQWLFSPGSSTWSEVSGLVGTPSARYGMTAAYLSGTGAVLFGGMDTTRILEETWIWNGSSFSQVNIANGTGPAARMFGAMAGNSNVFLFGGQGNGQVLFNDLWVFNGSTWTNKNPSNPPSVRWGHSMAYDTVNNVLVMFGGQNYSGYLNELWTYNPTSNAWTQQFPNSAAPNARTNAAMAFDTTSGKTIMFGGVDAGTGSPSSLTYSFNAATNVWLQL